MLSPTKLAKLPDNQSRCHHVNSNASVMKDGRKPFIVVSSRLMKRTAKGDLCLFRGDAGTSEVPISSSLASVVSPYAISSFAASLHVAASTVSFASTSLSSFFSASQHVISGVTTTSVQQLSKSATSKLMSMSSALVTVHKSSSS